MKTLKLLSFIVCLTLCATTLNSFSQDVIILSDGNEIEVKITKVSNTDIEYKKWNNQDGPTYVEKTSNIFLIKYQNGEKEMFTTAKECAKSVTPYKPFIGINAGFGITSGYWSGSAYFSAKGGIDLAFPIGSKFALGPYLSAGYDGYDETVIGDFGALAIIGEKNKANFIIGQGANFQPKYGDWGTSTRIGCKSPNSGIYLLGEFSTICYSGELYTYSFLFHIGFNFGK